jgi:hypothetical protein
MSQVQKGLLLGAPGPIGSPSIGIFFGQGTPTANPDPNLDGAQLGSLYIDFLTPALWFKTSVTTITSTGWTQISVP